MLNKITYYFSKIIYFPFTLFFSLMFLACNAIMLPFAYLKSLIHKGMLISKLKVKGLLHFLLWLIAGPFILAFSLIVDTVIFFIHSYTDKSKSFTACEHLPTTVTGEDLVLFRQFIEQKLAENVQEKGEDHPTVDYLNARKLTVALNKDFFVGELIMLMIYEPDFINKREKDRVSRMQSLRNVS